MNLYQNDGKAKGKGSVCDPYHARSWGGARVIAWAHMAASKTGLTNLS